MIFEAIKMRCIYSACTINRVKVEANKHFEMAKMP